MGTLEKLKTNETGNSVFPTLPSLLDDFFTNDFFKIPENRLETDSIPAVNFKETSNDYELEVAAPGMRKEDFSVELENEKLVISADRKVEKKEEDEDDGYRRREFGYSSFRRSFALSEKLVKSDEIKARYADGVLYVTIPKADEAKAKPTRFIEID